MGCISVGHCQKPHGCALQSCHYQLSGIGLSQPVVLSFLSRMKMGLHPCSKKSSRNPTPTSLFACRHQSKKRWWSPHGMLWMSLTLIWKITRQQKRYIFHIISVGLILNFLKVKLDDPIEKIVTKLSNKYPPGLCELHSDLPCFHHHLLNYISILITHNSLSGHKPSNREPLVWHMKKCPFCLPCSRCCWPSNMHQKMQQILILPPHLLKGRCIWCHSHTFHNILRHCFLIRTCRCLCPHLQAMCLAHPLPLAWAWLLLL